MSTVSKIAAAERRKHDAAKAARAAKKAERVGLQKQRIALQKSAILKSLASGSTVTTATQLANLDRSTFYDWLKEDAAFAAAAERAQARAIKSVEDAMFRRARSMTYQGGVTAGIFLLKNRRGEDYQDVHRVNLGGAVAVDRVSALRELLEGGESGGEDSDSGAGTPDA